jgi:hypothetical protein
MALVRLRKLGPATTELNIVIDEGAIRSAYRKPSSKVIKVIGGLSSDPILIKQRDYILETIVDGLARDGLIAKSGMTQSADTETDKHRKLLAPGSGYVNEIRIAELRAIASSEHDLSKLIRLCEEINISYSNECYFAVAMLVRAVLDHVPPIFGCKSFGEVANNYAGIKSFKHSMNNLENSCRKIADAHLHVQIRNKEALPNSTQVNFSNDLDVLLSEIVRLMK